MSGGAFHYEEFHLLQLRDRIETCKDEELCDEIRDHMLDIMEEISELHTKIKKLDYYLSGDSMEYK